MDVSYYSQFNEDALLEGLFNKYGLKNKWCLDVGAGDGIKFSNTRAFIEQGWRGVFIESDAKQSEKLKKISPANCCILNEEVSSINKVDSLLLSNPVIPNVFDLISIDIDGQDYYVWQDMERYKGRFVVIEFSPFVEPYFLPEQDTYGNRGKNQAGLNMMMQLMKQKGYMMMAQTSCNLICRLIKGM